MATVTFIKYKSQSAGALQGVARYVVQDCKTSDQQLVSGQNCSPKFAAQEFLATRRMHRKDSPVYFYHYVQSFHPEEPITGEVAHQVAKEFAERAWPDSEVLIATHIDADHIHSHFLVNAVCPESGMMLRQGPNTLNTIRPISDELCMKFGLSVLPKQQKKKSQGMSSREYRSAVKGESWKFRLMNTIDQCMRYASSKDEFLALMRSEGYEMRWQDSRQNITYTTPTGMKCRDDHLHDAKYLKENMEHEFRIREEIIYGRAQAAEPAAERTAPSPSGSTSDAAGMGRTAGDAGAGGSPHGGADSPSAGTFVLGGSVSHPDADGGAGAGCGGDSGEPHTGWEEEREAFLHPRDQTAQTASSGMGLADGGDYSNGAGSVVSDVVGLGRRLEQSQSAGPVMDSTTMRHHTDSKTLRKEKEKKIALGQKEDDHEDEQTYQQIMY